MSAHNHAKVTFFVHQVFVYFVRFKDVRPLDQFRALSFFAISVLLLLSSYRFSLGFTLPLLFFLKHLLLMQVVLLVHSLETIVRYATPVVLKPVFVCYSGGQCHCHLGHGCGLVCSWQAV